MESRAGRRAMRWLALAPLPLLGACAWVGLTWGALSYPTTQAGEAANVVSDGDWAYATRGAAGLEIVDLRGAPARHYLPLPRGLDSADDLALAGGLLFVLDAQPPGHLAVFSLANPAQPSAVGTPVPVQVGPFSGVSAGGGRVVVSGGTSYLSVRSYDPTGALGAAVALGDFGRGQPDVLLAPRADRAYVSTHEAGPRFSVTVANLADPPSPPQASGSVALRTYGFTPGGAKPANFPIELALEGDALFIASDDGLRVIGVGPAGAPRELAHLPLTVSPVNIDVRDGVAALVGSSPSPQLIFVDVHDPSAPRVLQSVALPAGSRGTGVALTATHAVVAAHGARTLLFSRAANAWELTRSPPASNQESRS